MAARGWRNLRTALQWVPPDMPVMAVPGGPTPAFAIGRTGSRRSPPTSCPAPCPDLGTARHRPTSADPETARGRATPPGGSGARRRGTAPPGVPGPHQPPPPRRMSWAPGALVVPFVAMAISALVVLPPLLITPGVRVQARARQRPRQQRLGLGAVELLRRRAQAGMGRDARRHRRPPGQGHGQVRVRARHVGVQLQPQPLRHARWRSCSCPTTPTDASTPWRACCSSRPPRRRTTSSTRPSCRCRLPRRWCRPRRASSTGSVNVPLGIQHLQLLGVKYFMASSPPIQDQADSDPALTLRRHHRTVAHAVPGPDRHHHVEDLPGPRLCARDAAHRDAPTCSPGSGAAQASWLPVAQRWYAEPVVVVPADGGGRPGRLDQGPRGRGAAAAPGAPRP